MKHKEKRFIRVNPHLPVKSLRETLDYYRNVLGFSDEWTWPETGEKKSDGGIRRDDLRLLFSEDPDFVGIINSYEKSRLPLMWFVENIDEIFQEFVGRKVEIADPLKEHPYGLREFSFVDINGYYIRVAERTDAER